MKNMCLLSTNEVKEIFDFLEEIKRKDKKFPDWFLDLLSNHNEFSVFYPIFHNGEKAGFAFVSVFSYCEKTETAVIASKTQSNHLLCVEVDYIYLNPNFRGLNLMQEKIAGISMEVAQLIKEKKVRKVSLFAEAINDKSKALCNYFLKNIQEKVENVEFESKIVDSEFF